MRIEIKNKITHLRNVPHLIQGEHNATLYEFALPAEFGGVDLTALDWELRCTNTESDTYYGEGMLKAASENVTLAWWVSDKYTSKKGPLRITLVGTQNGAIKAKFLVLGIGVQPDQQGSIPPTPDYFGDILDKIAGYSHAAQAAATAAAGAAAQAEAVIKLGLDQVNVILEQGMIVHDPVTGLDVPVQVALNSLYNLHRDDALTAAEYAALGLTAAEYAAFGLTAKQYSLHSKSLLGG